MPVNRTVGLSLGAAILLCSSIVNLAHAKPFMIVGLDEKIVWDDDGKPILYPELPRFYVLMQRITETMPKVGGDRMAVWDPMAGRP